MQCLQSRSGAFSRRRACATSRTHRARCVAVHAKLPKWDECYDYLVKQKRLKTISPAEAKEMVESGEWVLVDVRPMPAHKVSHPTGAVNVPMYQPLDWSKPDVAKVLRAVMYAFNGVSAVEMNPDFVVQLKQVTQGGKGLITLCEAGGTLQPTTNFPYGKASRSLQAAYRCMAEGVTDKVMHLERGVYGWYQAALPFGGEKEYTPDVGRTPMAAAEPTIEAIRASTGYTMMPGDKK